MVSHVPGRVSFVERTDDRVAVTIETSSGSTIEVRIVDDDADALWAAGEYWDALRAHGESIRDDLEEELRDMGVWEDDEN